MESAKDIAIELIKKMPDSISFQDLIYKLYVSHSIEEGLNDIKSGKVISHDEVMDRFKKWIK